MRSGTLYHLRRLEGALSSEYELADEQDMPDRLAKYDDWRAVHHAIDVLERVTQMRCRQCDAEFDVADNGFNLCSECTRPTDGDVVKHKGYDLL